MGIIRKNYFILILFMVTSALYLSIINLPLAPYDEAVILVGAERVLNGQVPNRDFFTIYPPGQVYTLAALFNILGISVLTERLYDIIVKTLLSISIYLIIRRLASHSYALIGWAMSLIWVTMSAFPAYPVYPSVLYTFVSVYLLLKIERQKSYIIVSALFIVLAALYRHDLGGLAAVALSLALVIRRFTGNQKSWKPVLLFMATGIIAGLPVVILLFMNSALQFMIYDLIVYPVTVFVDFQAFPYPSFSKESLPFYLFPLVPILGIITFFMLKKSDADDVKTYGILFISCLGIAFFNQVRMRSDLIHLLPSALTGILLAPILLSVHVGRISSRKRLTIAVWTVFVLVFAFTLYKPLSRKNLSHIANYKIQAAGHTIERAKYSRLSPDLINTVEFIKSHSSKNEFIYVGVTNHDQLVFNDAIFYFLSERKSGTKYHELNPGHTNTVPIQKEIIHELNAHDVNMIILAPRSRNEPNLSSIDAKIDLLDNYIAANYALEKVYGIYEIWMKKL